MPKKNQHTREFIKVNHFLMTVEEMAEELKISAPTVWRICNELKVVAITNEQRRKEYMASHPGKTVEQYAADLQTSAPTIVRYANQLGIEVLWNKQKEMRTVKPVVKEEEPTEEEIEAVMKKYRVLLGYERTSKPRFKEP